MTTRPSARVVIACLGSALMLAPLAWMWQDSLVGDHPSVMDMGYPDYGGGPVTAPMAVDDRGRMTHAPGDPMLMRDVTTLVADPRRPADVRVDLVARRENLTIGPTTLPGFTLNGTSPGPTISAVEGQLVEVRATNANVADGLALHWHGLDVPNAMDGVAGVTQDAIAVGSSFTYRFVADQAGTYWYHSHQVSNPQVSGGLFGALVVRPRSAARTETSVVATAHTYGGVRTINGRPGDLPVTAKPGERVRLRVINTDNGPMRVWASAPYRLLAVDGSDISGPAPVDGLATTVTSGGRADLGFTLPRDGRTVRVQLGKSTAVVLGTGREVAAPEPSGVVDLLAYGTPRSLGFDPEAADRRFEYRINYRPGFVRGRPGLWWSINGRLYPNVPMFVVAEGDLVRVHVENVSGEVHPMHLHGHHAVVLARDGVPATGAPWVVDSLNVEDGESYDLAFVADNPGVWMDHCHNLQHAADGMVAHLMYEGVTTPFRVGGAAQNRPE
ncbi:MAG: multicopper oxidase family protein [Actinomycetes bacterium]